MVAAMAYRDKYRKTTSDDVPVKQKIAIQSLGVHPMNRGGVYPAGIRCKNLCEEVITCGFMKEEVNHACVAVEEVPIEHARSRGAEYVSGLAFNASKSVQDNLLQTCFEAPLDEVRCMLLSHNHMRLAVSSRMEDGGQSTEGHHLY